MHHKQLLKHLNYARGKHNRYSLDFLNVHHEKYRENHYQNLHTKLSWKNFNFISNFI